MDGVIMFRPARLSEIILQHCYFVGIRTTQLAKTPVSCTNQAAQLDWGLLRKTTTGSQSTNTATQAPGGGTQDANCGAPERTRPTYRRIQVKVPE